MRGRLCYLLLASVAVLAVRDAAAVPLPAGYFVTIAEDTEEDLKVLIDWVDPGGGPLLTGGLATVPGLTNWDVSLDIDIFSYDSILDVTTLVLTVLAVHLAEPHADGDPEAVFLTGFVVVNDDILPTPQDSKTVGHGSDSNHYTLFTQPSFDVAAGILLIEIEGEHISQVPEPTAALLLACGILSRMASRRKRPMF